MNSLCLYLKFHHNLQELQKKNQAGQKIKYALTRRASLKDIIESLGIPHTEVAQTLLNNKELDFCFIPEGGEEIDILPFHDKRTVFSKTLLRPQPSSPMKFMVDINVQKIARNLRLIGIDTTMVPDLRLVAIAEVSASQKRILITRNRELLKCNKVIHGYLVRSDNPGIQLQEVVERYGLRTYVRAFTRCIICNGYLKYISKNTIYERLEPLTKKYFNSFKLCSNCGKIYWQGSHHKQLQSICR